MAMPVAPRFQHQEYLIRRKFLQIFGAAFHVYGPNGELVFYSRQKAFRLKEDIRLYGDENATEEVLTIHARSWLDFAAAYDVVDTKTGEKVGALKRRGFKSMVRDEWIFMDADDNDIGLIQEESQLLALVRRFVPFGDFIPQTYVGTVRDQPVCEFRQHFDPFIQKITLDFSLDSANVLDRRLGLAAAILLSAIEERQDGGGLSVDI
ncbi:MAG TPA: hypothetical protein VFH48_12625 [Chloroflexota bacterium]|nr:hypothetical protein [Chloroflexota bacterium]